MSRIGKLPVTIPSGVKVAVEPEEVRLEGPKGKLKTIKLRAIGLTEEADKRMAARMNADEERERAKEEQKNKPDPNQGGSSVFSVLFVFVRLLTLAARTLA